jgi:mono/diheme cytochrome c family protein
MKIHHLNALWLRLIVVFLVSAVCSPQSFGQPMVAGFQRFATAPGADARSSGRLLLGELHCTQCHSADRQIQASLNIKHPPILDGVGDRLSPQWVAAFIANPQQVKPGTTMPALLADKSIADKKKTAEALTHYLMTLRSSKKLDVMTGAAGKGHQLFNSAGCVACHGPIGGQIDAAVAADKTIVPLPDLSKKYQNASALAHFIADPLYWRPSGRMPSMNLSKQEAVAIASIFTGMGTRLADDVSDTQLQPGLAYEVYEGSYSKLPDFDKLKAKKRGVSPAYDIKVAGKNERIAIRWRGFIDITKDGMYSFFTDSDDGSKLYLGRTVIVDNDGVHGSKEVGGAIELKKGKHAITVTYFENSGGEHCRVSYQGPGIKKQQIPAKVLFSRKDGRFVMREDKGNAAGFVPDPTLVQAGRKMFVDLGCASCHKVNPKDTNRAALLEPSALATLKGATNKGCLSDKPAPLAPFFSLSKTQRGALAAALSDIDKPVKLSAAQRIDQTMTALNCYACHARGKKGGPVAARDKYFVSNEKSVGPEGRIPPALHDVGAKLTQSWLKEVLGKGTKVRPYMPTRMPVFGDNNISHLPKDFQAADAIPRDFAAVTVSKGDTVRYGRQLLGIKGMSCIACHVYNKNKAQGIQAMDLVHMPKRLKREWFDRYMRNPTAIRPGTRMPNFFAENRSSRQDILAGNIDKQLQAFWGFLSLDGKAPVPHGAVKGEILLAATKDEAVMYRNFIQNAGPRAIGVGYPGEVNIVFDANQLRLAMFWRGDFIDASKHWVGRGQGFQTPYGYSIIQLPDGPPLAVLEKSDTPWPKNEKINNVIRSKGFQFVGYELNKKQYPTFMYSFGNVGAKEFIQSVPGNAKGDANDLLRTITIAGPGEDHFFFVGSNKTIETIADGKTYKINDWTVTIESAPGKVLLRTSNGNQQLLIPVSKGGEIILRYSW